MGVTALNDEQTNQVRDEVWRSYVNNKLIEKEAKALGLTVSAAEIQDILKAGVHPLLRQTPFQNPQTGNFDKDMLNKFLVEYAKMSESQMPAQYAEQYNNMYKYWSFIQKTLIESRLAEKYQALVSKSSSFQSGGSTGRFRCKSEPVQRVDGWYSLLFCSGLYNRSERIGTERLV